MINSTAEPPLCLVEDTLIFLFLNSDIQKIFSERNTLIKSKASDTKKSKIRARVEHVFGLMEQSMNGLCLKSVGIKRATGIIGLINLTYNLFRYEQITRTKFQCIVS